jgi:anthranilate synthase component 1
VVNVSSRSPRAAGACLIRTLDTYPDLLPLWAAAPGRYPHLLESVAHGTDQARFDILFAFPGERLTLDRAGLLRGRPAAGHGDFLGAFDGWWRRLQTARPTDTADVPFRGGWFVYLGYELAGEIEPVLHLPPAPGELPRAFAVRCPAALVRDHRRRCVHLVAEADRPELLERMAADLAAGATMPRGPEPCIRQLHEEAPEHYLDGVRRIKDYIVEGDVFQVNLSRRWTAVTEGPCTPAALYRALRTHNPAPFAGACRWGRSTILSSSPERLVQVRGERAQTRPIAGTRPRVRGRDDTDLRELLGHPKERAEHVMLIDLERNDLGRVCRPGSVVVDELMALESYAHVHHIVSNVCGRLCVEASPAAVIRAVFPGGTITGCPKVRCMEIIAELEAEGRGPYTGSMGYINRDGDLDLNILIRTLVCEGRRLSLRAGAGIVADSDPERELQETRAKARGLLLALGTSD